jgi:hypothetical protein
MLTAIRRASSLVSNFGRSPPWLILEIDIRQLLVGTVLHDEAGFQFLDGPGRREAAGGAKYRLGDICAREVGHVSGMINIVVNPRRSCPNWTQDKFTSRRSLGSRPRAGMWEQTSLRPPPCLTKK